MRGPRRPGARSGRGIRRRRDRFPRPQGGETRRLDGARRGAATLPAGLRETARRSAPVGRAAALPIGRVALRIGRSAADLAIAAVDAAGEGLDRLADSVWAGARRVRPVPVLALVAGAALVVVGVAQFTDFRVVRAVTQDLDTADAGSAHFYALLAVVPAGIAALWLALAGGRPAAIRLLVGLGVITVLVSLAADLPQAGSKEGVDTLYDGVDARLSGGFYGQLAAGIAMILSGVLLNRQLRAGTRR